MPIPPDLLIERMKSLLKMSNIWLLKIKTILSHPANLTVSWPSCLGCACTLTVDLQDESRAKLYPNGLCKHLSPYF